jgi:hypothetical protein
MYRAGRNSVRERIIAAEVMRLEREQAARRGDDGCAHPELGRSRRPGHRPPVTFVEAALSFLPVPEPSTRGDAPSERSSGPPAHPIPDSPGAAARRSGPSSGSSRDAVLDSDHEIRRRPRADQAAG